VAALARGEAHFLQGLPTRAARPSLPAVRGPGPFWFSIPEWAGVPVIATPADTSTKANVQWLSGVLVGRRERPHVEMLSDVGGEFAKIFAFSPSFTQLLAAPQPRLAAPGRAGPK
jgi:hypothetical protein